MKVVKVRCVRRIDEIEFLCSELSLKSRNKWPELITHYGHMARIQELYLRHSDTGYI